MNSLEALDKMSCLSLELLHHVLKFRANGKILHANPQV